MARRLLRMSCGFMVMVLISFFGQVARAAEYPAKPVTLIVASGPGSATDIVGSPIDNDVREAGVNGRRAALHPRRRRGSTAVQPLPASA